MSAKSTLSLVCPFCGAQMEAVLEASPVLRSADSKQAFARLRLVDVAGCEHVVEWNLSRHRGDKDER